MKLLMKELMVSYLKKDLDQITIPDQILANHTIICHKLMKSQKTSLNQMQVSTQKFFQQIVFKESKFNKKDQQ